ncbi:hypothetical protein BDF14DRAFT_1768964 [Spinellus fusiger]|nr:hypothetical protein BDF14DRAFT_1768964 [Spinellus fusiger]
MSHYWGDFHSSQTRKTVITFIENISHYENMRPICDGLAPLAIREPPLEDPDAQWGLMDSDTDTDDFSDTPSTPKQHEKVKKKNSGYASESFKMPNFMTKTRPHSNPGIQYCSMDSTNNTNAHFSPTFLPVCSTPSIPQIPHESAQLKRTSSEEISFPHRRQQSSDPQKYEAILVYLPLQVGPL